ncbi:MAG: carboxymuconolactone decarboxylase family protein, partial [Bacteroidota bacterium]|nr:carboxymuconolactone decarboxylase family protein [Bacteroidota bacterium]
IQELMAQADLVNMLNTLADVSGIKIDNELMEAQA